MKWVNVYNGAVDAVTAGDYRMKLENILAQVYANSMDGQLLMDRDGRIVDCNDAALSLLGCSRRDEILGLRPKDISPEYQPDGSSTEDVIARAREQVLLEGAASFDWVHTRMDGEPLHVEVVMTAVDLDSSPGFHVQWRDISRRHEAEQALSRRQALGGLITSFSSHFINLPADQIDGGIEQALGELGEFVGADRSYLFSYHDGLMSNRYEWCAEGIEPQLERMQNVPVDTMKWSNDRILRGEVLNIPFVEELPAEAQAEKDEFTTQRIQSVLVVPMERREKIVGFIGFDAVRERTSWPSEIVDLLYIAAGIVANVLDRYNAEMDLREINLTLEQRIRERTAELAQRNRVAEALRETLKVVNSHVPLDSTLAHIAAQAKELSGAAACTFYSIDLENGVACREVGVGVDRELQGRAEFDLSTTPGQELMDVVSRREPTAMNYDPSQIEAVLNDSNTPAEHREQRAKIIRRYRAAMAAPLIVRDEPYGSILLYYDEPQVFNDQQRDIVSTLADQAALAVENARLMQSEQERRSEAEQRQRIAEGLRDGLAVLNTTQTDQEVLDFIIQQAVQLLGTGGGALYLLDEARSGLRVGASIGLGENYTNLTLPVGGAITGRAVSLREPVSVPDLTAASQLLQNYLEQPDIPDGWDVGLQELKSKYNAVLSVPVQTREDIYGAITLYYKDQQRFRDDEIALADAFAGQAALVIENAHLRRQVRRTAAVEERDRLARDLHDAVTQTLFSANLIADSLPALWEVDPEDARLELAQLGQMTRGALAEMRTLLIELKPSRLVQAEMRTLLQQLVDAARGRSKLDISLDMHGECELPPDVKVAFYRIAQEALHNILKHAGAKHVHLSLRCSSKNNTLKVLDDGCGFKQEEVGPGHFGVQIMQERAASVQAELDIDTAPGEGTAVHLTWRN